MARIRSVKPEFFTSETIAALSVHARLTFVGLWTAADDHGRAPDNPKLIKAAVWPLDDQVTASDVADHLDELAALGRICRYQAGGKRYVHIPTWSEHQRPKNPSEPKHPECPRERHGGPDPGNGATGAVDALPQPYPSPTPGQDQDAPSPTPSSRSREQVEGEVPPSAGRDPAPAPSPPELVVVAEPVTAQTLLAEYLDTLDERPPSDEVGQLARRLKLLVNDGIDPAHIRAGLADYRVRDLHPSVLPSLVAVRQRGGQPRARPGKTQAQREQFYATDAALDAWATAEQGGGRHDRDDQGRVEADRRAHQRQLPRPADTG